MKNLFAMAVVILSSSISLASPHCLILEGGAGKHELCFDRSGTVSLRPVDARCLGGPSVYRIKQEPIKAGSSVVASYSVTSQVSAGCNQLEVGKGTFIDLIKQRNQVDQVQIAPQGGGTYVFFSRSK